MMKRENAILIITEILWIMVAVFFWFVIWKITGITIDSWKFWALLFSIIGLWVARDIKETILNKIR
jgi:hypothetical protein